MKTISRFVSLPHACSYLPQETAEIEYVRVASMSAAEYQERMAAGWRRFGYTIFHPTCRACQECRTLRVVVDRFRPNRSQRRVRNMNEGDVRLEINPPSATPDKLRLYDRYHEFQSDVKDWPTHPPKDVLEYLGSYVDNPFPAQEYSYYIGDRLVAIGYVDALPDALSAVYCFYDPDIRERSLGTWNVLCAIEQAALSGRPHVYLGYFVAGCGSLEYKANFTPNQVRDADGQWRDFRA